MQAAEPVWSNHSDAAEVRTNGYFGGYYHLKGQTQPWWQQQVAPDLEVFRMKLRCDTDDCANAKWRLVYARKDGGTITTHFSEGATVPTTSSTVEFVFLDPPSLASFDNNNGSEYLSVGCASGCAGIRWEEAPIASGGFLVEPGPGPDFRDQFGSLGVPWFEINGDSPTPAVTIVRPRNGAILTTGLAVVSGMAGVDAGATVSSVTVDGIICSVSGSNWACSGIELVDGQNDLAVTVTDSNDETSVAYVHVQRSADGRIPYWRQEGESTVTRTNGDGFGSRYFNVGTQVPFGNVPQAPRLDSLSLKLHCDNADCLGATWRLVFGRTNNGTMSLFYSDAHEVPYSTGIVDFRFPDAPSLLFTDGNNAPKIFGMQCATECSGVTGGEFPMAAGEYPASVQGISLCEQFGCVGTPWFRLYGDSYDPEVTITSPEDGDTVTAGSMALSGVAFDRDASEVASVSVNGTSCDIAGDIWGCEDVPIVDGANTLIATATDSIGRASSFEIEVNGQEFAHVPTLTDLHQYGPDGTTLISEAGLVTGTSAVVKAVVTVAGSAQVKLQVEAKPFGSDFDDSVTLESGFVASGEVAEVVLESLTDGMYQWQARAVSSAGAVSDWQVFGRADMADFVANPDSAIRHVRVAVSLFGAFGLSPDTATINESPCKLSGAPSGQPYPGHDIKYFLALQHCVSDFFRENSQGRLSVDFVYTSNEWIAQNNQIRDEAFYAGYNTASNSYYSSALRTALHYSMVEDAMAAQQIDPSEFDVALVVHSGTSDQLTHEHGHMPTAMGYSGSRALGVISEVEQVGTWVHELGHAIGRVVTGLALPDLYSNGQSGESLNWSVMARGAYNGAPYRNDWIGTGRDPAPLTSHERILMGWLTPAPLLNAYGNYTLEALETYDDDSAAFRWYDSPVVGQSTENQRHHFLLEGRVRNEIGTNWSSSMPGDDEKSLVVYEINQPCSAGPSRVSVKSWLNPGVQEVYLNLHTMNSFKALGSHVDPTTGKDLFDVSIQPLTTAQLGTTYKGAGFAPCSILWAESQNVSSLSYVAEAHEPLTVETPLPGEHPNLTAAKQALVSAISWLLWLAVAAFVLWRLVRETQGSASVFARPFHVIVLTVAVGITAVMAKWLVESSAADPFFGTQAAVPLRYGFALSDVTRILYAGTFLYPAVVCWPWEATEEAGGMTFKTNRVPVLLMITLRVVTFFVFAAGMGFMAGSMAGSQSAERMGNLVSFPLVSVLIAFLAAAVAAYIAAHYKKSLTTLPIKKVLRALLTTVRAAAVLCLALVLIAFHTWVSYEGARYITPASDLREGEEGGQILDYISSIDGSVDATPKLQLFCPDGRHVGVNAATGEFENTVVDSMVSGTGFGSPEWIYIPDVPENADCKFSVSTLDNQRFLDANPEIAAEIGDTDDSYTLFARTLDPQEGVQTSEVLSAEDVAPGVGVLYALELNGEGEPVVSEGITDSEPPVLTVSSPQNGAAVSGPDIEVMGIVSDTGGAGMAYVTVNGVGCEIDGTDWSCDVPVLADANEMLVVTSDMAGNYASQTVTVNGPTSLTFSQVPQDYSNSTIAEFEFDSTVVGAAYECRLDAGEWEECESPVALEGLGEGGHEFFVRVVVVGEAGESIADDWMVDITAPEFPGIDEESVQYLEYSQQIEIGSTVIELLSGLSSITANGSQCALSGSEIFTCEDVSISEGLSSVTFEATDNAGNIAEVTFSVLRWPAGTSGTILIDSVPQGGPESQEHYVNSNDAEFEFHSVPGSTFLCKMDDEEWSSCTSPKQYTGLEDGIHHFMVDGYSPWGPRIPMTAEYEYFQDTVAPELELIYPMDGQSVSSSDLGGGLLGAYWGRSSEIGDNFESGLASVQLVNECETGQSIPPPYLPVQGLGWNCPSIALQEGPNVLEVTGTDRAGNVGTEQFTIILDTVLPDTIIDLAPPSHIDSSDVEISFHSSEEGSLFVCSLDGAPDAYCESPLAMSNLAEGPHVLIVTAMDLAYNYDSTGETISWSVDTIAPNTVIDSVPGDDAGAASFAFHSSEGGASFECSFDNGAYVSCTSPMTYSSIVDGAHVFEVRATDQAGNVDDTPGSYSWTALIPPDTAILTHPADPTKASTATFTYSATRPATFQCKLDSGNWSACLGNTKIYSGLTHGAHVFSVKAQSTQYGNDLTPATFSWSVDQVAPNTTIGTASTYPSNSSNAQFVFTANESLSTFECKLDSGNWEACTSPKLVVVTNGSRTFNVRAIDAAGNVDATPATKTWTVSDSVAPDTIIDDKPTNPAAGSSVTFTFHATEEGGTYQCKLDSGAYATCVSPKTYTVIGGPHTFSVRAKDINNNQDSSAATYSWVRNQ